MGAREGRWAGTLALIVLCSLVAQRAAAGDAQAGAAGEQSADNPFGFAGDADAGEASEAADENPFGGGGTSPGVDDNPFGGEEGGGRAADDLFGAEGRSGDEAQEERGAGRGRGRARMERRGGRMGMGRGAEVENDEGSRGEGRRRAGMGRGMGMGGRMGFGGMEGGMGMGRPPMRRDAANMSGDRPSESRISRALDAQLEEPLEFVETPLVEALDFIEHDCDFMILLDNRALDDEAVDTSVPITGNFHDVSLRSALNLMLRDYDLTFVEQDEVLMITTETAAEEIIDVRVYDVRDLIGRRGDQRVDADELTVAIVNTIEPASWDEVGGLGSIASVGGQLVIAQTESVHDDVRKLLDELRRRLAAPDVERRPGMGRGMGMGMGGLEGGGRMGAMRGGGAGEGGGGMGMGAMSPSDDVEDLTVEVYRVSGLSAEDAAEAIRAVVDPRSWSRAGASINVVRPSAAQAGKSDAAPQPGAIVVRQSPDVHRRIRELVNSVSGAGAVGGGGGGGFF